MGRFSVKLKLANEQDMFLESKGLLAPEMVRRAEIDGMIDSGATRLVLPEKVGRDLGLPEGNTVVVRYADNRTADRLSVHNVWLKIDGREAAFSAVLEPNRTTALVGAIVMEELDLVIDCISQKLTPRDPDHVIAEIE
jgi:predicted aspartyl protease